MWDCGLIMKDISIMKKYATLMTVFGLLSVLACAETPSGGTEPKTDAIQITPRGIEDITGIEWHLKSPTTSG
jgi:hypothetical protein